MATKAKALTRREITEKLHEAVMYYYVKKTYSVHREVGVERWGKARIDMMALSLSSQIIGIEVKSCLADFRADDKWRKYLSHSNKFYFMFAPSILKSRKYDEIKAELKAEGIGILTLTTTGRVRCALRAKSREVSDTKKFDLYKKLAWRGGDSKRNIKKTKRVYLE
jgi:hypothetical protein